MAGDGLLLVIRFASVANAALDSDLFVRFSVSIFDRSRLTHSQLYIEPASSYPDQLPAVGVALQARRASRVVAGSDVVCARALTAAIVKHANEAALLGAPMVFALYDWLVVCAAVRSVLHR